MTATIIILLDFFCKSYTPCVYHGNKDMSYDLCVFVGGPPRWLMLVLAENFKVIWSDQMAVRGDQLDHRRILMNIQDEIHSLHIYQQPFFQQPPHNNLQTILPFEAKTRNQRKPSARKLPKASLLPPIGYTFLCFVSHFFDFSINFVDPALYTKKWLVES